VHLSVLSRTVRSLYFRRHLATTIPVLEAAVWQELVSREVRSALIGGFSVSRDGTDLSIEPGPAVHPGQLWLPGVSCESNSVQEGVVCRAATDERR